MSLFPSLVPKWIGKDRKHANDLCNLRLSPRRVPGREEKVDELWLMSGMMSGRVDTQAKLLND